MLNGDGLRVVLSGCRLQSLLSGMPESDHLGSKRTFPFTEAEEAEIFTELDKDYIGGITFSGGDLLHPSNISTVTAFAKKIREKYPNKTIWLYTGSLWEEICNEEIVQYLDVCVDGEFQIDKRDTSLRWKGSSNQRVIDVPSTLREGKVVLHCDN